MEDVNMDCKCCRDTTLEEDINALPLDEEIKKKLLRKNSEREERLNNEYDICSHLDRENNELRNAVIYLAKLLPYSTRA